MSAPESTDILNTTSTPAPSPGPAAQAAASVPAPAAPPTAKPEPAASATGAAAEAAVPLPVPDALATAKKEAADNYDRYLRAIADLENFRKRTTREKDELRQFATARVLEDLLPVLDNLGLGLAATKQPGADLKTLAGGVEMVLAQLKSALGNHGLKEINPVGQPFDANLHESLSAQPSADVPEGKVLAVVRPGFSLNGRLLRPASVVLSSGAPKPEEAAKG